MPKKRLQGKVVSTKMPKTVVVKVERIKEHKKYKKRYKVFKKYKAHFEKGEYKAGDRVIIEECRPLSKEKKWRVVSKLSRNKRETPKQSLRDATGQAEHETDAKV